MCFYAGVAIKQKFLHVRTKIRTLTVYLHLGHDVCVPELGSLGELGTPCVTGIVVLDHLCCRLSPEHAFSFAAPDSGQRALIFTTRRRIGTLMPIHLPKQLVALQSWLTQERKGLESTSFLMSRRCTLST